MRKTSIWTWLLISILLAAPLAALLFLAYNAIGTPYPAFDLFDLLARVLPGEILTPGIDLMVDTIIALNIGPTDATAKIAEQLMATGFLFGLAVASGFVYFLIVRRVLSQSKTFRRDSLLSGLILGALFGIPVILITANLNLTATAAPIVSIGWLLLAYACWGLAHGYTFAELAAPEPEAEASVTALNRRQFLIQLGGATATITVLGAGLGALLGSNNGTSRPVQTGSSESIDNTALNLPNADDPLIPAPGTRPEYTPLDDHYRIDINTSGPPRVDLENYTLPINGLVENTVELTIDQIRNDYQAMDQYITMSCISNRIAGDLISTTRWTGTSMQNILELVRPNSQATHLKITAADGFDEIVDLALIREDERVMLTYDWDGEPLRERHGAPLRIHVPNHYGMKQPKWITGMEFIDSWQEGYWVRRGWDRDAIVRATSVIDTVAVDMMVIDDNAEMLVPIGGIAWAGARGIARVEVQIDGGEWVEAQLRSPLSDKTWVIWRYDWLFEEGAHTFAVRCVETDGTSQIETMAGVRPSGATGIHSVEAML